MVDFWLPSRSLLVKVSEASPLCLFDERLNDQKQHASLRSGPEHGRNAHVTWTRTEGQSAFGQSSREGGENRGTGRLFESFPFIFYLLPDNLTCPQPVSRRFEASPFGENRGRREPRDRSDILDRNDRTTDRNDQSSKAARLGTAGARGETPMSPFGTRTRTIFEIGERLNDATPARRRLIVTRASRS
jgi:hypothetical protein